MDLEKRVNIKNRSSCTVGYTLPDSGVRRIWMPNEIKKGITVAELEQATYISGGLAIIQDYLQINDEEVCEFLGLSTEPEYFYSEEDVKKMLLTGTNDQLLDCLDFAPDGVIDLIKDIALEVKINDIQKRQSIKEKTGFDVTSAISNVEYSNSKDEEGASENKGRRTDPIKVEKKEESTERRVVTPNYNRAK